VRTEILFGETPSWRATHIKHFIDLAIVCLKCLILFLYVSIQNLKKIVATTKSTQLEWIFCNHWNFGIYSDRSPQKDLVGGKSLWFIAQKH
jgi:hypothetical protein